MIESLVATNLDTGDNVDLWTDSYEVNFFHWAYPTGGEDEKRGQAPGRFENFKIVEFMAIDIRGAVLTDTPESFWTARDDLVAVFVPDPDATERSNIQLKMRRSDGTSNDYYANCVLDSWSFPLEALSPSVAQFDFGLDCRDGYWRLASATGSRVVI